MSFATNAYEFNAGAGADLDFNPNDLEDVPIGNTIGQNTIYDPDNFDDDFVPKRHSSKPPQFSEVAVDFFQLFSKYISLAFLVSFISLIILQPRVKYLIFARFIGYDRKILLQIIQAITIGILSSFSAYHTLS